MFWFFAKPPHATVQPVKRRSLLWDGADLKCKRVPFEGQGTEKQTTSPTGAGAESRAVQGQSCCSPHPKHRYRHRHYRSAPRRCYSRTFACARSSHFTLATYIQEAEFPKPSQRSPAAEGTALLELTLLLPCPAKRSSPGMEALTWTPQLLPPNPLAEGSSKTEKMGLNCSFCFGYCPALPWREQI